MSRGNTEQKINISEQINTFDDFSTYVQNFGCKVILNQMSKKSYTNSANITDCGELEIFVTLKFSSINL